MLGLALSSSYIVLLAVQVIISIIINTDHIIFNFRETILVPHDMSTHLQLLLL